VRTQHYQAQLSEAFGRCLVSLKLAQADEELLAGPANDLVAYKDSGGLWRMGHEYLGGVFRERTKSSKLAARIEARARGDLVEVKVHSELGGKPFVRWLWFRPNSPIIRMRLIGAAAHRRTITCRFPTTLHADRLAMDVPGGVVIRPGRKLYDLDSSACPSRTCIHI